LAVEGLSRALNESRRKRRIKGVRIGRPEALTHVLLIDDVILSYFRSEMEV